MYLCLSLPPSSFPSPLPLFFLTPSSLPPSLPPSLSPSLPPYLPPSPGSVFKAGWMTPPSQWLQTELAADFEAIRAIRNVTNRILETARSEKAIGSSLEAQMAIQTDSVILDSLLGTHREGTGVEFSLADILLVSDVTLDSNPALPNTRFSGTDEVDYRGDACEVKVSVWPAAEAGMHKCGRCWKFTSHAPDTLCQRCQHVMDLTP